MLLKKYPHILLLMSDEHRPDILGAEGNPVVRTPNLDEIARKGTYFRNAYCTSPVCVPSRAEIMTGVSGFRNGVTSRGGRIKPDLVLWARAMRDAGYHSWYVGKWMSDGRPTTRGYEESLGLFTGGAARWWRDSCEQPYHRPPAISYDQRRQ